MTRTGKYLELRPFSGQSLSDCINYLKRDVAKSFADLFSILGASAQNGEIVTASASATPHATATYASRGKITLKPGVWDITGCGGLAPAATTVVTRFDVFIGTAEGASNEDQIPMVNSVTNFFHAGNVPTDEIGAVTPTWRVTIPSGSSQTYYLNIYTTFSVSTMSSKGFIRATKVME